ncbi:MAG: DinB family protein [Polaribacter sp.]|nr:DinB family protein [Polaribacter sp.]
MIRAIVENLERGIQLLNSITDSEYSNATVPPYFSSIGCNIRHVLDAFTSIIKGFESGHVDFSDRKRNTICEAQTEEGIRYIKETIQQLNDFKNEDFTKIISVTDNLGNGDITINYTLENALAYAHSHAIHHFASIGFLVNQLVIELQDADFGYNPTTPKINI